MTDDAGFIEVVDLATDSVLSNGVVCDITRPDRFFTFSYYSCPVVLQDRSGRKDWPAGVSILCAPGDPIYVQASCSDTPNTWFRFSGPGVEPCLAKYGIPTSQVLDLGELPFLRTILDEVRQERIQRSLNWEDAVSDLVRRFLRELGSAISNTDGLAAPTQTTSARLLRDVRMRVHSQLAHHWTVTEMATVGGMDPNRFAKAYKKQFGLSPLDDLINARLKHAEDLLRDLPITVNHVAVDCGFANVEHFTRLFHKRTGITPGQIRKQAEKIKSSK